jgi:ABC transporter
MATTAAIRTTGLSKDYGSGHGLFGLDLEVRRGEILGFLGPNGAGKSTAMRLLLDLIRPTSGSAQLLGLDSRKCSLEIRRRVGFLAHPVERSRLLLDKAADRQQRQYRTDGERKGRGAGRLQRPGTAVLGQAELVAGMGFERIVGHQGLGDLLGQRRGEAAAFIDARQLGRLTLGVVCQLTFLEAQVSRLGVTLGADRYVLAGRHRPGAREQTGDPGRDDRAPRGARGGNAEDQARSREDAVVGPQDGGPKPV